MEFARQHKALLCKSLKTAMNVNIIKYQSAGENKKHFSR